MTDRANTTARGYGHTHQQLRKQVAILVSNGEAVCWRCGRLIQPWAEWDLGHSDTDRSVYMGPEHQRCNRAAAARRGNRLRGKRAKVRRKVMYSSRDW